MDSLCQMLGRNFFTDLSKLKIVEVFARRTWLVEPTNSAVQIQMMTWMVMAWHPCSLPLPLKQQTLARHVAHHSTIFFRKTVLGSSVLDSKREQQRSIQSRNQDANWRLMLDEFALSVALHGKDKRIILFDDPVWCETNVISMEVLCFHVSSRKPHCCHCLYIWMNLATLVLVIWHIQIIQCRSWNILACWHIRWVSQRRRWSWRMFPTLLYIQLSDQVQNSQKIVWPNRGMEVHQFWRSGCPG